MELMAPKKIKITLLTDFFLPGFRGGGSLRAVSNLVKSCSEELNFEVLTRDRDLGASENYDPIVRSQVSALVGCPVRYLPPGPNSLWAIRRAVAAFGPDLLYINSVFSPAYGIWPLSSCRGLAKEIIIAPRGELLEGALTFKRLKKGLFLDLAQGLGLYQGIHWHATCMEEAWAIQRMGLNAAHIHVAEDLPSPLPPVTKTPLKMPGSVELLFLARLHPLKGLHRIFGWLPTVKGKIRLRVAGPEVDKNYMVLCRQLASELPPQVEVLWIGPLSHNEVMNAYQSAHVAVLPTESENHSYTIQEALSCGCPVLTSEGTPWKDLAKRGSGWTLPLGHPGAWVEVLQQLVDQGQEAHAMLRERAFEHGRESVERGGARAATLAMFKALAGRSR